MIRYYCLNCDRRLRTKRNKPVRCRCRSRRFRALVVELAGGVALVAFMLACLGLGL